MKRGKGLRLGVIGVGSMGKNYARLIADLPGAKLAGVSDSNQQTASEVAAQYHSTAYPDYQQMLPEVDAVCIVTPAQTHFEIASACLNLGKHVLLEKPFTGSTKLATDLLALSKEKGITLSASFLERFNPAFARLMKLIKGEKIHGIDIQRFSPFPERITDTDVVFDMMIHDLDLLSQITSEEIEDIKVEGEKVRSKSLDRVVATFTHKLGTISRVNANRVYTDRVRKITITTEKQLIDADLLNRQIYIRDFSVLQPSTVPVKEVNQLGAQLLNFIKAIKENAPPMITASDAIKALTLAEEVERLC